MSNFSFAPCLSSLNTTGCVAWAVDAYGNDVTSSIQVVDVTPCNPNATFCLHCSPAQMTIGACLDGNYTFQYTAKSTSGNRTSSLFINFIVEDYNYTALNITAGYVNSQYGAVQLVNQLQYDMAAVSKLVYNKIQVQVSTLSAAVGCCIAMSLIGINCFTL